MLKFPLSVQPHRFDKDYVEVLNANGKDSVLHVIEDDKEVLTVLVDKANVVAEFLDEGPVTPELVESYGFKVVNSEYGTWWEYITPDCSDRFIFRQDGSPDHISNYRAKTAGRFRMFMVIAGIPKKEAV